MDGSAKNIGKGWWRSLSLACTVEFQECAGRICSWPVPNNWCARDWFEEICAVAAEAAWDAEFRFDPGHGITLDAFVHSRVLNRALSRYRQEWTFSHRFVGDFSENGRGDLDDFFDERSRAGAEGAPGCGDLLEVMAGLPDQDTWLITQIYWKERTEAQIGQELGISQRAVSKRKHVVLRSLSRQLMRRTEISHSRF